MTKGSGSVANHTASIFARFENVCDPSEVITVRHEEMLRDLRSVLSDLCVFLGMEPDHGYLDDCCSVVFGAATYTCRKVAWTTTLVSGVERWARAYRFLDGYQFETRDTGPASNHRAR